MTAEAESKCVGNMGEEHAEPNAIDDPAEGEVIEAGEPEEGRNPRAMPSPQQPTEKEIEEHALTHWPYRSWCPILTASSGEDEMPGIQRLDPTTLWWWQTTASCPAKTGQGRRGICIPSWLQEKCNQVQRSAWQSRAKEMAQAG